MLCLDIGNTRHCHMQTLINRFPQLFRLPSPSKKLGNLENCVPIPDPSGECCRRQNKQGPRWSHSTGHLRTFIKRTAWCHMVWDIPMAVWGSCPISVPSQLLNDRAVREVGKSLTLCKHASTAQQQVQHPCVSKLFFS